MQFQIPLLGAGFLGQGGILYENFMNISFLGKQSCLDEGLPFNADGLIMKKYIYISARIENRDRE